jgi:hypothetical protein
MSEQSVESDQPTEFALSRDIAELKYAREAVNSELRHHQDKKRQIFSWASTLLVAITGGVISIENRGPLPSLSRFASTVAVGILWFQALLWGKEQSASEKALKVELGTIDKHLRIPTHHRPFRAPYVGARETLSLLAIAAIIAIWCTPRFMSPRTEASKPSCVAALPSNRSNSRSNLSVSLMSMPWQIRSDSSQKPSFVRYSS